MGPSGDSHGADATRDAVDRFNAALEGRDFDALAAALTEDCLFEDTDPRPDGTRYAGRAAVVAFFRAMVEASPRSTFDVEEAFTCGDRCVVLWNHRWVRDGVRGHNRGVDLFRVRDGRVAEKLAYTKNG